MKVKTVARCFLLLHFLAQNFCYILASGKECKLLGSGCGSADRAAASDTTDPHFESRHQQNFIYHLYNRKYKNKEKEARNGPSLKKLKRNVPIVGRCGGLVVSVLAYYSNDPSLNPTGY